MENTPAVTTATTQLRDQIQKVLNDSEDWCARCQHCDRQLDAVMAIVEQLAEERDAARQVSKGRTMEQYDAIQRAKQAEDRVRAKIAEDLRRAAEGRREYAKTWPRRSSPERVHLEAEAEAFDSAARVAEGDRHTMCALLPVAMWTDAENEIARGEGPPRA